MPNLSNTKLNAEIIKQQLSKNNAGVKIKRKSLNQGAVDTGAIQQVIPSISNNIMLCDDAY